MKYNRKAALPVLVLSMLLSACVQSPVAEVQPLPPTPSEALVATPTPIETPMTLTLAGEELYSAIMLDYTNGPFWSDYRMNREAGLEEAFREWGFSADDPFYRYDGGEEGIDLTFYYDAELDCGLGIFWHGEKKLYGFGLNRSFSAYGEEWDEWTEGVWDDWARDPMSPPERNYPESWSDFREEKEYDEAGRLISLNVYANTGDTRFDDPANCWLYQVKYVYDEADTLRYKDFWGNPAFGNYAEADEFWYDDQGRLAYAEGYITHGRLYYYYIYKDNGSTPAYLLKIDDNMGYADPLLIRYPAPPCV